MRSRLSPPHSYIQFVSCTIFLVCRLKYLYLLIFVWSLFCFFQFAFLAVVGFSNPSAFALFLTLLESLNSCNYTIFDTSDFYSSFFSWLIESVNIISRVSGVVHCDQLSCSFVRLTYFFSSLFYEWSKTSSKVFILFIFLIQRLVSRNFLVLFRYFFLTFSFICLLDLLLIFPRICSFPFFQVILCFIDWAVQFFPLFLVLFCSYWIWSIFLLQIHFLQLGCRFK